MSPTVSNGNHDLEGALSPLAIFLRQINEAGLLGRERESCLAFTKDLSTEVLHVLYGVLIHHLKRFPSKAGEHEYWGNPELALLFAPGEEGALQRTKSVSSDDSKAPCFKKEVANLLQAAQSAEFSAEELNDLKAGLETLKEKYGGHCEYAGMLSGLTLEKSNLIEVVHCIAEAGLEARQMFLACNTRFAVMLAKARGHADQNDLQDAIGDAYLGLVRAVEKFDPWVGDRFTTYASHWVKQTINSGSHKLQAIHVPNYIRELRTKVNRMRADFVDDSGKPISVVEALRRVNYPEHKVPKALKYLRRADIALKSGASGNQPGDEEVDLSATIAQTNGSASDAHQIDLNEIYDLLDDDQKVFVRLYYGLEESNPKTLKEIGEILGCTRERVRQILAEIAEKLRDAFDENGRMVSDLKFLNGSCFRESRIQATPLEMGFAVSGEAAEHIQFEGHTGGDEDLTTKSGNRIFSLEINGPLMGRKNPIEGHNNRKNLLFGVPADYVVLCDLSINASYQDGKIDWGRVSQTQLIPLSSILPNSLCQRKASEGTMTGNLVSQILKNGIEEPILICRPSANAASGLLLQGLRRVHACELISEQLGIPKDKILLPCDIHPRGMLSDEEQVKVILSGYLHEEAPGLVGTALTLKSFMNWSGKNTVAAAEHFGMNSNLLTNMVSLTQLPRDVQILIDEGKIPAATAFLLPQIQGEQLQRKVANVIVKDGLSALDVKTFINQQSRLRTVAAAVQTIEPALVRLSGNNGTGTPEIIAQPTNGKLKHAGSLEEIAVRALIAHLPDAIMDDKSSVRTEWKQVLFYKPTAKDIAELELIESNQLSLELRQWLRSSDKNRGISEPIRLIDLFAYYQHTKEHIFRLGQSQVKILNLLSNHLAVSDKDRNKEMVSQQALLKWIDHQLTKLSSKAQEQIPLLCKIQEAYERRFSILDGAARHVFINPAFMENELGLGEIALQKIRDWIAVRPFNDKPKLLSLPSDGHKARFSLAELEVCFLLGLKLAIESTGIGTRQLVRFSESWMRYVPYDPPAKSYSRIAGRAIVDQIRERFEVIHSLRSKYELLFAPQAQK